MQKLKKYFREIKKCEIIEYDFGFISYQFHGDVCLIVDIYIDKEKRLKGLASKMADDVCKIAIDKKCTEIQGMTDIENEVCAQSMQAVLGYGMRPYKIENNKTTYYVKEL